jgi:catechol 2,3-dioxygenase-like lactoylglutathione lyase family enzyme
MERNSPLITVQDIAWGRLQSPDLDAMEQFLVDFGMVRSARTANALYMRGTGPTHHLHITQKGERGFVSVAYLAASEDDLKRIATTPGAMGIENIDEPGGGKRVRIKEPVNGFLIEVVHGVETPAPLEVKPRPLNWKPEALKMLGQPERLQFGASRVKRLSHCVFATPRLKETLRWFGDNLGFILTDQFYKGEVDNVVGSFNRLNRGSDEVDHHVINCYESPHTGMQHLSYVVQDVEDLFVGHNHLKRINRYEHMRGVGYHPPGGQIFDYWLSPCGQMHEHYFPTQRFTASSPANIFAAPDAHDPTSVFANTVSKPVA